MGQIVRTVTFIILINLVASLSVGADGIHTWQVYAHDAGTFVLHSRPFTLPLAYRRVGEFIDLAVCPLGDLPSTWHVLDALPADLTRDGDPECALLVWRPWQDWPIMRWSDTPSPIAANQDAGGDSAHVILVEPTTGEGPRAYREKWAGSALAVPIVQIAVGDVDGDGGQELVALEGDYATGRYGPARHVAVWRWNGFGFTLEWRGPVGCFVALALADLDGDGVAEILVR